jgi:integrase
MPPIKVKNGPVRQISKGKEYWYAWRRGPRLHSTPGSQAFLQELADAVAARQAPDTSKVSGLVALYRGSSYFLEDLAPSTRDLWNPWLDKIRDRFGTLSIRQFDRPAIKPEVKRWHHSMRATPRAADTGLQVLSRVLAFGMSEGKLASNQCEGMAHLHKSNRADVIWSDEDLTTLLAHASPEMAWAARLAALTGLRRGDLVKLAWTHVGEFAIELKTGKSRGRRTVTIPMIKPLRDLLSIIPKRATTVLTSSDKRPWTGDGLGSSWWKLIQESGLKDKGLRFHDFRGTAATRLYRAQLPLREIAEILGWSEDRVEKIINRYVKLDEILKDRIRRIEQAAEAPGSQIESKG